MVIARNQVGVEHCLLDYVLLLKKGFQAVQLFCNIGASEV